MRRAIRDPRSAQAGGGFRLMSVLLMMYQKPSFLKYDSLPASFKAPKVNHRPRFSTRDSEGPEKIGQFALARCGCAALRPASHRGLAARERPPPAVFCSEGGVLLRRDQTRSVRGFLPAQSCRADGGFLLLGRWRFDHRAGTLPFDEEK